MSHPINTQFLETAAEEFDNYLTQGDLAGMKSVVARLSDNGFEVEAQSLLKEMQKAVATEKLDDVEVDTLI